MLPAVSIN